MNGIVLNEKVTIFNVDYRHIVFENRDELYVTRYGEPFLENLFPENMWTDEEWFSRNAQRLAGTSCLYHLVTKEAGGKKADIVLKWNRMGQDIPGSEIDDALATADFNSPFEEFSLVFELRNARSASRTRMITHKPYAVYVPGKRVEVWQSGRRKDKFERLVACHDDVAIDIRRLYAVVYEWIRGKDAAELCVQKLLSEREIADLTLETDRELAERGFLVRDRKPQHLILRPSDDGGILRGRDGKYLFGLVDFELLERLPERESDVRRDRRILYLKKQKERFDERIPRDMPAHLFRTTVFGVDYVYGKTPGTDGALWVVGLDPELFDYFLPEKWEKTPRIKLSVDHEIFYTLTKDNIHLVFKLSRVGMRPNLDPFKRRERRIIEHGYNSPFEELSLALELGKRGIPTIYPRGVYMTGNKVSVAAYLTSDARCRTHENVRTPGGECLLKPDRDYIIIYGYWNGPDEKLSQADSDYEEGIDALRAYNERIISRRLYQRLLDVMKRRLFAAGMEDLNLRGSHFLLSFDSNKKLIRDRYGVPEMRYCNFEFLRKRETVQPLKRRGTKKG